MIVLSFRNKRDKDKMLEKAKTMEEYASELVDCLQEARHGDYDDEEYSERSRKYRNRYDYR